MATGQPAFQGKTPASIIAAILALDPAPIPTLQPTSPPEFDRLARTALAKNPDERWQSAHDIRIALASISATRDLYPQRRSRTWWWIVAGVVSTALLGFWAYSIIRKPPPSPPVVRLTMMSPRDANFSAFEKLLAIAPNGRVIAFTAIKTNGQRSLWVRRLDSSEAKELPGTDDADSPFWSPDSRLIGFYSHSKLKKVDPAGGQPEVICDAGADPGGATWSRDGIIVFAPNFEGVLYRVPAAGGKPLAVTEAYQTHDETNHVYPEFLPDGRHFLFLVFGRDDQGIHVGSLDSKEHHLILRESSSMAYVEPGYLLFGRNGALMAQRFDPKRIQILGEPIRIVDALEAASGFGYSFSVSADGVLVYWTGRRYSQTQLTWYRRDGAKLGTLGPVGPFRQPRISSSGKRVVVNRFESGNEISAWSIDARGVPSRLSFGDFDLIPLWSPDEHSVIFSSPRDGLPPNLFQKTLTSASEEHRLMRSGIDSIATDWSRDGRYAVYMANELGTNWNIWAMPLAGDRTPEAILRSQFSETDARISPDVRWLAYVSDESGRWEVYAQPFLSPGGKWQISSNGGAQPQWSHDGKELFYVASDQTLMAVPVHAGESLDPGAPKPLFQLHTPNDAISSSYDVAPDDQRFLVSTLVGEEVSAPLTVVINWTATLKTK